MSEAPHLCEGHPLARAYRAGSPLCPVLSPSGEALKGIGGRLSVGPEHFSVHELPRYRASGEGEHCFVHILKVGRSTDEALEALAQGSSVPVEGIGYAGRKDRDAVSTQWLSLPCTPEEVSSADPEVVVLSASPHEQKLKLGHLSGNLFSVLIDEVEAPELLDDCLSALARGVPNYFGPQRFGRPWYSAPLSEGQPHPMDATGAYIQDPLNPARDNVDRALELLAMSQAKGRAPKMKKKTFKLMLSALQSALFNLWLGERLRDGLGAQVIEGDVCRKLEGGTFTSSDSAEDSARLMRGEIEVLGPLIGPKLFPAQAEALAREEALYERWGLSEALRGQLGRAWRGDRRAMRLRPAGLKARREQRGLRLSFTLPSGAYATTIAGALIDPNAVFRRQAES